jgi:hypothetical protein
MPCWSLPGRPGEYTSPSGGEKTLKKSFPRVNKSILEATWETRDTRFCVLGLVQKYDITPRKVLKICAFYGFLLYCIIHRITILYNHTISLPLCHLKPSLTKHMHIPGSISEHF